MFSAQKKSKKIFVLCLGCLIKLLMMFKSNLLLIKWKTINLSKKNRYLLPRHYVRCTFERIWNILKIIWMFESELNIWMNAKSQIRFETQPMSPPQMRRKDSSSNTHECLTSEIPDQLYIFNGYEIFEIQPASSLHLIAILIWVNLRKFEESVGVNSR